MTDRNRQTAGILAQFSLAVSVAGLAITLMVGIWKLGTMWGTVTNEHQRIFEMIRERCK